MFLNKNANSRTRKKNREQTKVLSRFDVKAEISPAIRDFSRGEQQVLHVVIKSNDN